jgi:hypothetical protein
MKNAAEHSSAAISARFVHPSEDKALEAISRLGGHNEIERPLVNNGKLLTTTVH